MTEKAKNYANVQTTFVCGKCDAPLAVRVEPNRKGKFVGDSPAFQAKWVSSYGLGLSVIVQPCEQCIEKATKPARDLTRALSAALKSTGAEGEG